MASAADRNPDPDWILRLKHGGAVPLLDFHHCSRGWSSPPGNTFQVRGPNYLESKVKIPAGEWVLKPIAFDWIKNSAKIVNIMKHQNGRVRVALEEARKQHQEQYGIDGNAPFVWAINLQVPSKENHSLIMYYVSFNQPPKGSLMQRFLDGDNAFRNSRLKLLANVAQGPWIVKTAVGERAICLLGKAVTSNYIREEHYMELDVDIGSSMMAHAVVQLAFGSVTSLTVDLAFVLEGQTHNELPERILGAIRFANLEPSSASSLESPLDPDLIKDKPADLIKDKPDLIKDKPKSNYNRLWRSFSTLFHAGHQDPVANVEEEEKEEEEDGDGDHKH